MKRFLIMFMVLGLVAGSVTTAGATQQTRKPTPTERTVVGSYGPLPAPVTGCNEAFGQWACVTIPTRTNEAFLTAKVTDAHGLPVYVEVHTGAGVQAFCGETVHPISFPAGSTLRFHVALNNWLVSTHCPAHRVKTTGTITVTLANVAPPAPERSGTISTGTGWLLDSELGGCEMSPECGAWLANDCDPLFTEWDPALTASIVDVDELADGPPIERVFRFGPGQPSAPWLWGRVHLQFWTSDCLEIPEARWRSTDCDTSTRFCSSLRFRMPLTAKWMTVTGYQDNFNLIWTLT